MTNGLQIVTSRLLVTNVGVDGSVTRGTGKVLAFSEGNVLSFRVLVALGKTKIDDVDVVLGALGAADQEVVGLDISVNNALFVHFLDALDHLDSDVEHCLEVELASALLEEILKGLAEEVHDHDVIHLSVFGLLVTDEVKERHESLTAQLVDKLALPEKHDVSLHLNCFFYFGGEVLSSLPFLDFVNFSESTASEFLNNSVAFVQNFLAL